MNTKKIIPLGIRQAFSHKNFQYYITGHVAMVLGFWMQSIASAWLVSRMTGSSVLLGTATLLALIPSLIISPFAGVIVDKFPKKHIIYCMQIVSITLSLIMSFLIITDTIQVWYILLNAFMLGTTMSIEGPARNAFMVKLVPTENLQNAIAINSSTFNLGRLVGPALGGILIPFFGEGLIYFLNALAFSFAFIEMRKISFRGESSLHEQGQKNLLFSGFAHAYNDKATLYALISVAVGATCMLPVNILMPLIVSTIFHGNSMDLGIFSACTGLGGFAAALSLASRTEHKGLMNWYRVGSICFCIGLYVFTFSPSFILSAITLVILGFGSVMQTASLNTVLQTITPDEFRGRVMAMFSMMLMGMGIFGSLFAGFGGEYIGIRPTIFVGALGATASLFFLLPRLTKSIKSGYTL